MTFFYKTTSAVLLVLLTLFLQYAGVGALIEWLRSTISRDINKFGPLYSAGQVVRSTLGIIVLHGLAILLWASFYRSSCFRTWELAFYF
jgi:hypothetical protein